MFNIYFVMTSIRSLRRCFMSTKLSNTDFKIPIDSALVESSSNLSKHKCEMVCSNIFLGLSFVSWRRKINLKEKQNKKVKRLHFLAK